MCVTASNAIRTYADSFSLMDGKGHWSDWHYQTFLGKWYYRKSVKLLSRFAVVDAGLLLGLGVLNLMLGGITRCSSARIALIKLVIPDAPSECPTFGFT